MASPFQGKWQLYGVSNLDEFMDSLALPMQFKNAMKHVRTCEEVHVNGDNVHLMCHVPSYCVPAHGKDINFEFGVEAEHSLPFGKKCKATVTKESENKWSAKLNLGEGGNGSITRELRNGEMWVTIESGKGVKCVRKFERSYECPMTGCKIECDKTQCEKSQEKCSPFQGCWRLYGSENFDKYMESIGVPCHWQCIFANLCIRESIHVNGNHVHVKVCVPEVIVPQHCHEHDFKFGVEHEFKMPFGHAVKATAQKVSDSKWQGKFSCGQMGDGTICRELLNGEMWVTIEMGGKRVTKKYERCMMSCGQGCCGGQCGPCGPCK